MSANVRMRRSFSNDEFLRGAAFQTSRTGRNFSLEVLILGLMSS
jgi:hypothetical protein